MGKRDSVRAFIAAFDDRWTYLGVRRGERRKDLWIWTAVVAGTCWCPLADV